MKKYTTYYKSMMFSGFVCLMLAWLLFFYVEETSPTLTAISLVAAFIFLFCGEMAPDYQKFKNFKP